MRTKTVVFTSAALNYIPKVRMLFNSLRELHPEIELHLALSDILPKDVDLSDEPFDEVHPISELGIPDWKGWTFCHSIVELSTAIKPFVLEKLLLRPDTERVIYFDPDMVLFSRVDDLLEALEESNVILTPHQTEPESRLSAVIDNEICSLKHGVYNLGFVGVSATDEGLRFANWWKQRIYYFCRADIPNGLFTDQRWIDLVPAFFSDVAIIRSPRHNVAPWNVTTRDVTGSFAEGFQVNGEKLGFYHFTGFDSGAHRVMASINARPASKIGMLIDWYERETAQLALDPLAQYKWAFAAYSNGEKIDPLHRLIYRERVDLQRAFTDPFDASNGGYFGWVTKQGILEYPNLAVRDQADPGLDMLKRQLTPGFRPSHEDNLDWNRIRNLAADVMTRPSQATRYAKRAWEILRQEGIKGVTRRLS
ncbi:glycosyl transferase [Burkholderia singularis]|nr:glycosyl transferase [Burkholderia singularis]